MIDEQELMYEMMGEITVRDFIESPDCSVMLMLKIEHAFFPLVKARIAADKEEHRQTMKQDSEI